jgi:hypothetical protein
LRCHCRLRGTRRTQAERDARRRPVVGAMSPRRYRCRLLVLDLRGVVIASRGLIWRLPGSERELSWKTTLRCPRPTSRRL